MLLKKNKFIFIFILLILSCNTINYKFIEKVSGNEKINFYNSIIFPFGNSKVKIYGIYIEQNNSYKFDLFYDYVEQSLELKFYSILKNTLLFTIEYKKLKKNYYGSFFGMIKRDEIIKKILYFLDVIPKSYELYNTKDDYYVIIDSNKNYQKYDLNFIIKKENLFQVVKYYYEDNKIKRIEYKKGFDTTIFIIKVLEIYE